MKTKRAFLTGISGMVGSHLLDYLFANTDYEIHGLIRWQDNLENLEGMIKHINNQNRIFYIMEI